MNGVHYCYGIPPEGGRGQGGRGAGGILIFSLTQTILSYFNHCSVVVVMATDHTHHVIGEEVMERV